MDKRLVRILSIPNDDKRDRVRNSLNDYGFYVLSGSEDTLEVYVCQEHKLEYMIDIFIIGIILIGFYIFF